MVFLAEPEGFVAVMEPRDDESYDLYTAAAATYSLAVLGDATSYSTALLNLTERADRQGVSEIIRASSIPDIYVALEFARAVNAAGSEALDPYRADLVGLFESRMAGPDLDDPDGPYDSSAAVYTEADRLLSTLEVGLSTQLESWLAEHPVTCESSDSYPTSARVAGFAERNALEDCGASERDAAQDEIAEVLAVVEQTGLNAGTCTALYQASLVIDDAARVAGRTTAEWIQWAVAEFDSIGSDVDICGPSLAIASEWLGAAVRASDRLLSTLEAMAATGASVNAVHLSDADALAASLLLGDDGIADFPDVAGSLRSRSIELLAASWAQSGNPPSVDELANASIDSEFGLAVLALLVAGADDPPCASAAWLNERRDESRTAVASLVASAVAVSGCVPDLEDNTDELVAAAADVLAAPDGAAPSLEATWAAASVLCLLDERPSFPPELSTDVATLLAAESVTDPISSGALRRLYQLAELAGILEEGC